MKPGTTGIKKSTTRPAPPPMYCAACLAISSSAKPAASEEALPISYPAPIAPRPSAILTGTVSEAALSVMAASPRPAAADAGTEASRPI